MRPDKELIYGTWAGILAYVIWGFFPIYWKWLQQVPALQLVCHRVVWTCVMLSMVIVATGQWRNFIVVTHTPRLIRVYLLAALLMGLNWLLFTVAVDAGQVTQAGLGYYMSPLFNVLMGVLLLGERLRRWQWLAVGLAAAGVVYLASTQGTVPWIALGLAFSFGSYGLLKKLAPLVALHGLLLETSLLLPAALTYLIYCAHAGLGKFDLSVPLPAFLMVMSGLLSMTPLLLFAYAAQRIPLARLGFLQYITPTLQLLLGILLYREPFNGHSLIGFGMVWVALLIYGLDGFFMRTARRAVV